jgi:aspartyl-tRNA synthetase
MGQKDNVAKCNSIAGSLKTHHCGEIREQNQGEEVKLCGWVNKYRDLGGLYFIDLRDKYGVIQLGFENFKGDRSLLKSIGLESVVSCRGKVRLRPESAINQEMKTGMVEVQVEEMEILSRSEVPPFLPEGKIDSTEDLKLKYRYIDLRTSKLQSYLSIRSETVRKVRNYLYQHQFTEVETPILFKTTPEGARDYIVPSRVHPGHVYALPQSPQTLKQLLMLGGTDRYFQISKCFRDEDLRADRQPEFTQIDIEASFIGQEYMQNLAYNLMAEVFDPQSFSFELMSYDRAIELYGSDKPDTRFELIHHIVTNVFENSDFKTFAETAAKGGIVKALFLEEGQGKLTRKQVDQLKDTVAPGGAKGVAWFKVENGGISGGISKFITEEMLVSLGKLKTGNENGMWLFISDLNHHIVHHSTDILRRHLGRELNLIDSKKLNFLWVYDFPLFDWDEDSQQAVPAHHPFTSVKKEDRDLFLNGKGKELLAARANAYDLVCNGHELASGSIRIFDTVEQEQMFNLIGLTKEDIDQKFGFFVEALKYGTPPHGGMAIGLDRLVMIKVGTENIRDVIAFPKTTSASDLMANCPSVPDLKQFEDLGLNTNKK